MTNEEIIRAIRNEIERLLTKWETADHLAEGLLSFLSTLESENTMSQEELELNSLAYLEQLGYTCIPEGAHTEKSLNSEVLEKEIESYWKENGPMSHAEYDRLAKCARHFYEIGCRRTAEKYDEIEYERQRAEESVPNDLEEAAVEYEQTRQDTDARSDNEVVRRAFIAGAKWQEEKEKEYSPWLAIPGLKEAALEFGEQAKDYEIGGQSFAEDMAVAFTRGAEWQKGQMMEEAVEISYKGGMAIINGEEKPFEGGTVRVIFLPKED